MSMLTLAYRLVGIGLGKESSPLNQMPSWGAGTWSYHGDNGKKFHNSGYGFSYAEGFTTGDIVSCRLDICNAKLYFGKNGKSLGKMHYPLLATRACFP